MSQSPPIPQANQSPYPIQEPPHVPAAAKLPPVAASDSDDTTITDRLRDLPLLAIGAAVGLGAAVVGAAVFGMLRAKAKPEPKRRGSKRKAR